MSAQIHYLTIGDLHGRNLWHEAVQQWLFLSDQRRVVFLGDYVDSRTLALASQLVNLHQVLALKKEFPDRVILLLGNHDAHYLWTDAPRGSGFSASAHAALFPVFQENAGLFQLAYEHDTPDGQRYLWTHAGVSNAWIETVPPLAVETDDDAQAFTLGDTLNYMADSGRLRQHLLAVGAPRGGHGPGGPLWADAQELKHPIVGFHQIVGHTALPEAKPLVAAGNATTSLVLCDYNDHADGLRKVGPEFFYQLSLEV